MNGHAKLSSVCPALWSTQSTQLVPLVARTAFMWRKCGCNEGQQSRLSDYREHCDPGNVSSSDSQLFNWCCLSPRLQPTVCLGALSGKTWEEECWMQMELSILQMSHISPLHLQTCSLTDSQWGVCFVAVKDYGDWICVKNWICVEKSENSSQGFTNIEEQRVGRLHHHHLVSCNVCVFKVQLYGGKLP